MTTICRTCDECQAPAAVIMTSMTGHDHETSRFVELIYCESCFREIYQISQEEWEEPETSWWRRLAPVHTT